MRSQLLLGMVALAIVACSKQEPAVPADSSPPAASAPATQVSPAEKLDAALAALPEAAKARFPHRHPKETLEFFGIVSGMTVVDTLPDEVWYTGILLDYLGPEGKVIGADYSAQMWSLFGEYAP